MHYIKSVSFIKLEIIFPEMKIDFFLITKTNQH